MRRRIYILDGNSNGNGDVLVSAHRSVRTVTINTSFQTGVPLQTVHMFEGIVCSFSRFSDLLRDYYNDDDQHKIYIRARCTHTFIRCPFLSRSDSYMGYVSRGILNRINWIGEVGHSASVRER